MAAADFASSQITPQTQMADMPQSAHAANYALSADESGQSFSNEGATSLITFTLPPAAQNLRYTFYVENASGIRIQAIDNDVIRIVSVATPANGSVQSVTVGGFVTLKVLASDQWVAISSGGTWS